MPLQAIRPAQLDDLTDLAELLRISFTDQALRLGLTPETAPWHVAFRDATQTEREMGYLSFFMAISDERPVGCIAIQSNVEPEYGGDGYIGRVAVHPQYRRRGYARMLMRFAETALGDRGAKRVRLVVISVLDDLIEFYARQGYEVVGHREYRDFGLTDMDKKLVP